LGLVKKLNGRFVKNPKEDKRNQARKLNLPCLFLKSHPFTNRKIASYKWELGDGNEREGKVVPLL